MKGSKPKKMTSMGGKQMKTHAPMKKKGPDKMRSKGKGTQGTGRTKGY